MTAPGKHWCAACLLALASAAVQAAPEMKLYPIRGLFVAPADQAGSLIHPQFQGGVSNLNGGAYFEEQFRQYFPGAATKVGERDKRSTLISSLQIARASFYSIDKINGTSDLFVPVSGSLYFTNAVTGEVLYTVSATFYHRATVSGTGKKIGNDKLQAMFATAYRGLVGELLTKAREQFKPHVVSATIKSQWHGLYILDRGQDAGVAKGDTMLDAQGQPLDVLFSTPSYAVARSDFGALKTDISVSREANGGLADTKKPRVMVLVDKTPDGFAPEILRQVFTDVLGTHAPVSVVHVNPLFSDVLKTAFSRTDLSSESSNKRELPDFFIRLSVPESRDFEMPTTLKYKTLRSYRTIATAELVDRSGRVLYATSAEDKIDDEVTGGMGFDVFSRREVSIKNALLSLAQRIGAELKFDSAELSLQSVSPLTIKDPHGMLADGEQLTVYRNIGKVAGIGGDVRVPLQTINVDSIGNGTAGAVLDLPTTTSAQALAATDVVLLETASEPHIVSRRRFAACGPAEQLGAVNLPAFGDLALNAFAKSFKAPFYSDSFFNQIKQLLGPGSRFKSDIKLLMATPDYCVQPVYRVDVGAAQCDGDPRICRDMATVRITLRIKNGSTVVAKSGLETKLSGAGYLENAPAQAHQNSLATDLLAESAKLAKDIAAKLNQEKFN